MSLQLTSPQPLLDIHQVEDFRSGERSLDEWLMTRAMANQLGRASRTFVVIDELSCVRGYYEMAAGAVSHQNETGTIRRNMPNPMPVLVLGRLAIDRCAQGMNIGASMLQDAVERALSVSQNIGVRALLVHAINDSAKGFYRHCGFTESPIDPMTLMLRIPA
jgi:GNAT superfamily N-acetyltransferase